ncbi:MAG: tetraacyldisaccharide 4'-kinase [Verrucomicrobiaceae bacterium]|nr:tetraacyldisaccharide 4'-kinase [Verrucomicrobiaceae bacterium]
MKDTLEDLRNFITDVILNNRRGWNAAICRVIFWALSSVYSAVVSARVWLFKNRYIHASHLGVPVIAIGNLTVGGTGKTPVVELISRTLHEKGRSVAILSRGYKSKKSRPEPLLKRLAYGLGLMERPPETPPRVVSDGRNVLLDSHMAGDEPRMLANNLPGVPVLVDKNRVKAGKYAIKNFNVDALVLDDGMQYLKLQHRLDIVLVDRTAPFGTGYLLPRGTLREPARHLKRASYIFITKSEDAPNTDLIANLRKYNRVAEIIECRHRPVYLQNMHTCERLEIDALDGKFVGAFSGIAVPESFENGLKKLGAKVEVTARFPDHHRFHVQDLLPFLDRCDRRDVEMIVTTEKDIVRFPDIEKQDIPIYFMRVQIEILRGQEVFDKMIRLITEPRSVQPGVLISSAVPA